MSKRVGLLLFTLVFAMIVACSLTGREQAANCICSTDAFALDSTKSKNVLLDSRDCQKYKTVKIGKQTWMAENLNYKTPNSYCYGKSAENCVKYGRLYTWESAKEACPAGWHLPSQKELVTLFYVLGGQVSAGKKLKSSSGWNNCENKVGNGSDSYGFAALPAGIRYREDDYNIEGYYAFFWSSTENAPDSAKSMYMYCNADNVDLLGDSKKRALSVRCIKDEVPDSNSVSRVGSGEIHSESQQNDFITDSRDGQTYKIVQIGSQKWMAQNLNYETPNSYCYKDSTENCAKYGRLYTWSAAMDSVGIYASTGKECGKGKDCLSLIYPVQGICPEGFHLPTQTEWNTLISSGRQIFRDSSDFAASYGGFRHFEGGYIFSNKNAYFWTSTEHDAGKAYYMKLRRWNRETSFSNYEKDYANSVRCVQDESFEPDSLIKYAGKFDGDSSLVVIPASNTVKGSFTDSRDGKKYKTVTIGSQTWMAENLSYKMENSHCLGDKASKCEKYGRLYEWAAAKNACPAGWRLPSKKEWNLLVSSIGGPSLAGLKLRTSSGWCNHGITETNYGESTIDFRCEGCCCHTNGDDLYGFSVLPASEWKEPEWSGEGYNAFFWSATEHGTENAVNVILSGDDNDIEFSDYEKSKGYSVRCILDSIVSPSAYIVQKPVIPDSVQSPQTAVVFDDSSSSTGLTGNLLTDARDGQTYKTVTIGEQTWMAENLNYNTSESFCYNDSLENCAKYGRLYTWAKAVNACPAGWHLPTLTEWDTLVYSVGGQLTAGNVLKSTEGWYKRGNGVDGYGFSALPVGIRFSYGAFDIFGRHTYFWSSTEHGDNEAYGLNLYYYSDYDDDHVKQKGVTHFVSYYSSERVKLVYDYKANAAPVRCIKNVNPKLSRLTRNSSWEKSPAQNQKNVFTDSRDERTYRTVTIGNQIWIAENLKFKTPNSSCYEDKLFNCAKYGRLYTWTEAMGGAGSFPNYPIQGVCPAGWHLPTQTEWRTLVASVGGVVLAGGKLKTVSGWANYWPDTKLGTDDFGFSARPAGKKDEKGKYVGESYDAYFWGATGLNGKDPYSLNLYFGQENIYQGFVKRNESMSVRCVKDEPSNISIAGSSSFESSDESQFLPPLPKETFTDSRDGKTYGIVTIGYQTWMTENLNFQTPNSFCYKDNPDNCAKYGRLYTWSAAMDSIGDFSQHGKSCGDGKTCDPNYPVRGVCPEGFHLPTTEEFKTLYAFVGGERSAGKRLKSRNDWSGWSSCRWAGRLSCEVSKSGNGTDDYGFTMLPAGRWFGSFEYLHDEAFFWTSEAYGSDRGSTEYILGNAYATYLTYDSFMNMDNEGPYVKAFQKSNGFSVRCVKDE